MNTACRLSAEFEHKDQLKWFEDTFCSFAEAARARANEHIRQYRRHGDLTRLVPQVVTEYGGLLKYGAYLLGHLDGLGLSVDKDATRAKELFNREKHIASAFDGLAGCVRSMWAGYETWLGLQVFNPLCELADKILRDGGIEIEERTEGPYVVVPFSWETI